LLFLPTGVMLLYLAWRVTSTAQVGKVAVARIATTSWIISWMSVVGYMLVADKMASFEFVAQRDLGYYFGSAAFIAIPFFLVGLASFSLQRRQWSAVRKSMFAFAAASVGFFFIPSLFFSGWIVGCVLSGYSSCL
jgi:hypothetical protein